MGFKLKTIRSNMTNFATMMASKDKFQRSLSHMRRNIHILRSRQTWLYTTFFFLRSNLLILRSSGFQLRTIWSNVTNNPTMVACRNKLYMSMFPWKSLEFGLHTNIHTISFALIQVSYIGFDFFNFHRLNKQSFSSRIRSMWSRGTQFINKHSIFKFQIVN